MYGTVFWTLWEKARVGCFKGTASKHVYYLGWNRSPAQVGCMRQALGPGALGKPRGSGWRGRWEGGSEWGTHVNPWLIHFKVWQNSLQIKKKGYSTHRKNDTLTVLPWLELWKLCDFFIPQRTKNQILNRILNPIFLLLSILFSFNFNLKLN